MCGHKASEDREDGASGSELSSFVFTAWQTATIEAEMSVNIILLWTVWTYFFEASVRPSAYFTSEITECIWIALSLYTLLADGWV